MMTPAWLHVQCVLTSVASVLQVAPLGAVPVRWLNLQEYQSKKLMQDNGIAVQKFRIAENTEQALDVSKNFSE